MLCLDTFQVIQLICTFFYFGEYATTPFSNRRCIVTMLPARRQSATFDVGFELAASREQLLSTAVQHDVLCKMLRNSRVARNGTQTWLVL